MLPYIDILNLPALLLQTRDQTPLPYASPSPAEHCTGSGDVLGSSGPPFHHAEMGIYWKLSVGMKPVKSWRRVGTGSKASPPDAGAGANSSPPAVPRKAASSQLVPWSRKNSPFLSLSTPFHPEMTGQNKVQQPCRCPRPPLKPTALPGVLLCSEKARIKQSHSPQHPSVPWPSPPPAELCHAHC